MNKWALVTGASSGIGLEFAKILARKGYNLVIVARRLEQLEKLKKEITEKYSVQVFVSKKDLSIKGSCDELTQELNENEIQIDVLINNAGFGLYGSYTSCDDTKEEDMIKVNILALNRLTKLLLPGMVKKGWGRIVQVASVAGFFPGPFMAVYYATKAYVLSFSQALGSELEGSGVTVTALCPGPTESGFRSAAEFGSSSWGSSAPTSRDVAEFGYRAMKKGQPVAIYGLKNKLFVFLASFLPRGMVVSIIKRMQQ